MQGLYMPNGSQEEYLFFILLKVLIFSCLVIVHVFKALGLVDLYLFEITVTQLDPLQAFQ